MPTLPILVLLGVLGFALGTFIHALLRAGPRRDPVAQISSRSRVDRPLLVPPVPSVDVVRRPAQPAADPPPRARAPAVLEDETIATAPTPVMATVVDFDDDEESFFLDGLPEQGEGDTVQLDVAVQRPRPVHRPPRAAPPASGPSVEEMESLRAALDEQRGNSRALRAEVERLKAAAEAERARFQGNVSVLEADRERSVAERARLDSERVAAQERAEKAQAQLDALRARLQSAHEEISESRDRREAAERGASELEAAAAQAHQEAAAAQEQAQAAQVEAEALREQVQQRAAAQPGTAEARVESLQAELVAARAELSRLRTARNDEVHEGELLADLKERLAAREEALAMLEEQAEGLHAAVNEARSEGTHLRRDLERRRALERQRFAQLERTVDALQGSPDVEAPAQGELRELVHQLLLLSAHDADSRPDELIARLERQRDDVRARLEAVEEESEELRRSRGQLVLDLTELSAAHAQLSKDHQTLQDRHAAELAEARVGALGLEQRLAEATAEAEGARAQAEQAQEAEARAVAQLAEARATAQTATTLEAELAEARAGAEAAGALEAQLGAADEARVAAEERRAREVAAVEARSQGLEQRLAEVTAAAEGARTQAEQAQEAEARAVAQLAEARATARAAAALEAQLAEARAAAEAAGALEAQLDAAEASVEDMRSDLLTARAEAEALQSRLQAAQAELRGVQTRLAEEQNAQAQSRSLDEKVRALEQALEQAHAGLRRQADLERRYSERILQLERQLVQRRGEGDGPGGALDWGRQEPLWDDAKVSG